MSHDTSSIVASIELEIRKVTVADMKPLLALYAFLNPEDHILEQDLAL